MDVSFLCMDYGDFYQYGTSLNAVNIIRLSLLANLKKLKEDEHYKYRRRY